VTSARLKISAALLVALTIVAGACGSKSSGGGGSTDSTSSGGASATTVAGGSNATGNVNAGGGQVDQGVKNAVLEQLSGTTTTAKP